jgi:hypothetical protein
MLLTVALIEARDDIGRALRMDQRDAAPGLRARTRVRPVRMTPEAGIRTVWRAAA